MYKNVSDQWFPFGGVGPFSLQEPPAEGEVMFIKCTVNDLHNIPGSRILRFEPPYLIFTKDNYSESHSLQIQRHISYPKAHLNTPPSSKCALVPGNESTITTSPLTMSGTFEDNSEKWLLVSHLGPLPPTGQPPPEKGTMRIWECTPKNATTTRVVPSRVVVDSYNYSSTNSSYMALFVEAFLHPDDQPVPEPNCVYTTRRIAPQTSTPASNVLSSRFLPQQLVQLLPDQTSIMDGWWMYNWLAFLLVIFVCIYHATGSSMKFTTWRTIPNQDLFLDEDDDDDNDHKYGNGSKTSRRKSTPQRNHSGKGRKHQQQQQQQHHHNQKSPNDKNKATRTQRGSGGGRGNSMPTYDHGSRNEISAAPTIPQSPKTSETKGEPTELRSNDTFQDSENDYSVVGVDSEDSVIVALDWEDEDATSAATHGQSKQSPAQSKDEDSVPKNFAAQSLGTSIHQTRNRSNSPIRKTDGTLNVKLLSKLTISPESPPIHTTSNISVDRSTQTDSALGESKGKSNSTMPDMSQKDEVEKLLAECAGNEPLESDDSHRFELVVEGMTCRGCAIVVKNTLQTLQDIRSVSVNWEDGSVVILSPVARLDLLAVSKAIDAVGFSIFLGGIKELPKPEISTHQQLEPANQELSPPPGFKSAHRETSLSLIDKLRTSSSTVRRYACHCGGSECICREQPLNTWDQGRDLTLSDLCKRIEDNIGSGNNPLYGGLLFGNQMTSRLAPLTELASNHGVNHETLGLLSLEDIIRSSDGGSVELRERLAAIPIPCGCDGSAHKGEDDIILNNSNNGES